MGEPSIDVKRRAADPVFTAQFRDRRPTLGLAQHSQDMRLGKTSVLYRNFLVHSAKKILRTHPLNQRGDYQQLKEELGLDHFEGRSWTGLHGHALMTTIARAWLQARRLTQAKEGKKESPAHCHNQACPR